MLFSKIKFKKTLSLLEIFIVASLFLLIVLASYSTLNNGIKIWKTILNNLAIESLNIFFDKLFFDIKNIVKFNGMQFFGSEERLEIPTLVESTELNIKSIGKVVYIYDPKRGVLTREVKDYSCIYNDKEGYVEELEDVSYLKFEYYFYNPQKGTYEWTDCWLKENLPLAVRVKLELKNELKTSKFTRTIDLPLGG